MTQGFRREYRWATLPMRMVYAYAARTQVAHELETGARQAHGGDGLGAARALRAIRFTAAHAYFLDLAGAAFHQFTVDNRFGGGRIEGRPGMGDCLVFDLTEAKALALIGGLAAYYSGRAKSGAGKAVRQMKRVVLPIMSGMEPPPTFGVTINTKGKKGDKPSKGFSLGQPIRVEQTPNGIQFVLALVAFPLRKKRGGRLVAGDSYIHLPAGLAMLEATGGRENHLRGARGGRHSTAGVHRLLMAIQARWEKKVFGRGMYRKEGRGGTVMVLSRQFIAEHRPSAIGKQVANKGRKHGGVHYGQVETYLAEVCHAYRAALRKFLGLDNLGKFLVWPTTSRRGATLWGNRACRLRVSRSIGPEVGVALAEVDGHQTEVGLERA